MNKKNILIALSMMLIFSNTVALAAPLSSEERLIEEKTKTYNEVNLEVSSVEEDISKLDNDISTLMSSINETNLKIEKVTNEYNKTKKDYDKAMDLLGSRIRGIYKQGKINTITILLESDSFSDLIERTVMVKKIVDIDKKVINDINTIKDQLETKENELLELKDRNEKEMVIMDSKKKDLNSKLEELRIKQSNSKKDLEGAERALIELPINIINNSNSLLEISQAVSTLVDIRHKVITDTIDKEIDDAIIGGQAKIGRLKSLDRGGLVPPNTSNSIILYSYQFLGIPYVWGGETPTGFDCSGLTSYVYRHFGYEIGRTTYEQIYAGISVPLNDLKPGDLLFWGDVKAPHHVGMYIGGDKYIQAPHTGDVVKISQGLGSVCAARRIIK